jgi:hypothetical protein
MNEQLTKGSSVFLEGRAWFDNSGGNTYHSVRIWVNGEIVSVIGLTYGYENAYQTTAITKLVELGYLPNTLGNNRETREYPTWQIERILEISIYSVLVYGKKSELWKVGA